MKQNFPGIRYLSLISSWWSMSTEEVTSIMIFNFKKINSAYLPVTLMSAFKTYINDKKDTKLACKPDGCSDVGNIGNVNECEGEAQGYVGDRY